MARARVLLAIWDRSAWQRTARPVGMWRTRTAVSTLFTFWPPAPPARMVVISMSSSGSSKEDSTSSAKGEK